jgi:4-amino-4-deoxy-L-arabinose transferase-like glycosyltransferase
MNKTLLLLIILLAFAARVYQVGNSVLHGDEAFAVLFSTQDVGKMLQMLRSTEPHPPLYFLSLHYWMGWMQDGELAVRFPSLFLGMLVIPLVYRLARQLFPAVGERLGLLAAILVAVNPFLVWHSQETRMYMPLVTLSLGSMLLSLEAWERGGWRRWVSYVVITLATIYTHYNGLFILLVQNLVVLFFWVQGTIFSDKGLRRWSLVIGHWSLNLSHWLLAQLIIGLLYLPWAFYGGAMLLGHTKGWIEPVTLFSLLQRALVGYSLGLTVGPAGGALAVGFLAIFVIGLAAAWREKREGAVYLGVYLFIPLLTAFLISVLRSPFFTEHYFIFVSPAYILFLAWGVLAIRRLPWGRWAGPLVLFFMLTASAGSLYNYYYVPPYSRGTGWRDLMNYLLTQAQAGDVIIQNFPDPALPYYLKERLPRVLLPYRTPVDPQSTEADLERLWQSYQRAWFLPFQSPGWDAEGFVERWLDRHAPKIAEQRVDVFNVSLYLSPRLALAQARLVEATLGGRIQLLAYQLEEERIPPGGTLHLTLYWRALEPPGQDYTVFTHLYDGSDHIWGQKDNPPVGGTYPTSQWRAGETIVDRYYIILKPETPPGDYRLVVGVYNSVTGARLAVTGEARRLLSDHRILLAGVRVER